MKNKLKKHILFKNLLLEGIVINYGKIYEEF